MGLFKKLLSAVGVGGASVETVLHTPGVQPGGQVTGVIRMTGGEIPQEFAGVFVELVTKVEHEHGDSESDFWRGVNRLDVHREFTLAPGQVVDLPYAIHAPLDIPITHYKDAVLQGTHVALKTQLEIKGALDATDHDPLGVGALPQQHIVLDAVERLGFRLHSADVEAGHLRGTRQRLPFYQEIEFRGSPQYPRISDLEVSFAVDGNGMDIVFEVGKRAGLITGGRELFELLSVSWQDFPHVNWPAELHPRLERLSGGWL